MVRVRDSLSITKLYFPSTSVTVPKFVLSARTVAPIRGSPEEISVTTPEMID